MTDLLVLAITLAITTAAQASDLAREQRLAEQIVDAILGGNEDRLIEVIADWLDGLDGLVMPDK